MALKCGIIGITNTGKTTLFNCISNTKGETSNFAFSTSKSNMGIVKVPDPRLYQLEKFQPTEKVIQTTVELVDVPGLAKGSSQGEGVGNKFLADIRNTDALIHVLRCFDDDNLAHIDNSINPVRDKENVDFELQVKDLELVERKIEKQQKIVKSGDKEAKQTLEVLNIYKEHLENFQSARTIDLSDDDKKAVADLDLLSAKPIMYVCNVDEASANTSNKYVDELKESIKDEDTLILTIAAGAEADIAELETEEERMEFLNDLGLDEPGVDKLVRAAYDLLKLKTFFTIGPKEIRAWTIKDGMSAPQAAGVIHSDLERGFIRAEVIKFDDFIELESENACKEKGKLKVEGKNYIVDDGDILHIRFNV